LANGLQKKNRRGAASATPPHEHAAPRHEPVAAPLPIMVSREERRIDMRIVGIVLIILGILVLGYQGFTYVSNDKIAEVGPVEVRAQREHTVWIPPVVGGVAVIAGAALLVLGSRRTTI